MNAKQQWLDQITETIPATYQSDFRQFIKARINRNHSNSRKAFYQWVMLQVARDEDAADFLTWLSYGKLPPEFAPTIDDGFEHTVNGDVALIPVGDNDVHAVWRIPVAYLDWARAQFPVWLKRLPDLEPIELKRQREIKHQLHYMRRYMTTDQLASLRKEVNNLDAQVKRAYEPVPRYQLMRTEGGRDVSVHRLFIGASEDDEIEAVDGDFLNFCPVKHRKTFEPVVQDGYIPANRPEPVTEEISVNNLQIMSMSDEKQEKFESKFLPFRRNDHGEMILPYAFGVSGDTLRAGNGQVGHSGGLEIHPNWDLGKRAGVEGGRIEDCGVSQPLAAREKYSPERFGRKPQKTLNPDVIRRAWRESRRSRGRGF